jgi:putative chitinase
MGLLSAGVGTPGKAANNRLDIKAVQILLNFSLPKLTQVTTVDLGFPGGGRAQPVEEPFHMGAIDLGLAGGGRVGRGQVLLDVTGRMDKDTLAAIMAFQTQIVKSPKPDGVVSARGGTIDKLMENAPRTFTAEVLQLIMIEAPRSDVDKYYTHLSNGMTANNITTPLRTAHFLAQVGHESGALRYTEEGKSGAAYEGRADLGNTQPGDGPRFKGRGLIQITGRANYQAYGTARGRDYVADPTRLATDPAIAVDCSFWFWNNKNLNTLADADNVTAITEIINGGHNGLADRKDKLARAKALLVR